MLLVTARRRARSYNKQHALGDRQEWTSPVYRAQSTEKLRVTGIFLEQLLCYWLLPIQKWPFPSYASGTDRQAVWSEHQRQAGALGAGNGATGACCSHGASSPDLGHPGTWQASVYEGGPFWVLPRQGHKPDTVRSEPTSKCHALLLPPPHCPRASGPQRPSMGSQRGQGRQPRLLRPRTKCPMTGPRACHPVCLQPSSMLAPKPQRHSGGRCWRPSGRCSPNTHATAQTLPVSPVFKEAAPAADGTPTQKPSHLHGAAQRCLLVPGSCRPNAGDLRSRRNPDVAPVPTDCRPPPLGSLHFSCLVTAASGPRVSELAVKPGLGPRSS